MTSYELLEHAPTLGDLIDCELVADKKDPWAVCRLLQRWMKPEPNVQALRTMPVLEAWEHVNRIIASVRHNTTVLSADAQGRVQ